MHKKIGYLLFLFLMEMQSQSIKTIQLKPANKNQFSSIVPLGTVLELSFDDLDADSKEYQYKIAQMTYDWKPSRLLPSQYINGFDQNTIIEVSNSFNTFQNYTHYSVQIPNQNTVITKSGNYLLSVLDENDTVIFTRRFVLYEKTAVIGVSVVRSRNPKTINEQQAVHFSINHSRLPLNNPSEEIDVVLLKNNNWNEKITNLKAQFYKPNQLIYRYIKKTNFEGGNEYLNFDTKTIRNKSMHTKRIEQKEIFHHYLHTFEYNPYKEYSYNPDINGQFVIRALGVDDPKNEGDYVMMHFSLQANKNLDKNKVYVYGAFNDFELTKENEMPLDKETGLYKTNILLKQGFYNYTFAVVDTNGNIDLSELNNSFYQTENQYTVLVYYKPFAGVYERVIGVGTGFFNKNP